jgi:hypothetical protein
MFPGTASVGRFGLGVTLAIVAATQLLPAARPVAQFTDVLAITAVSLDPPTLHALGVQMLIRGDQNRNASVTVRYRPAGSSVWRPGPPLFRVFPETVPQPVPEQFAGSIFDLAPDTSYEIELHATDADGPVDELRIVTGRTRPVPRDQPVTPRSITVASAAAFHSALASAVPGDVIVLANGIYPGPFVLLASGTAENPLVIRGESTSGVILDGQDCARCNVFEATGSYVHIERLTIQNALRALRFLGPGAHNNVVRRIQIENVVHGIAGSVNQRDFYICDNIIEGRLAWPWVFAGDATRHWDDRGVALYGNGHVVCHNRIKGFGDPLVHRKVLARSLDFYGNDILDSWDGLELDGGSGNVRVWHNRFTNVVAGISAQPVYGGPAYLLRNVVLNVTEDQIKYKPVGGDEPSGMLAYHNTFVSPKIALNLGGSAGGHNFQIMNNLFVGPRTPRERTVTWSPRIDRGMFDHNGYFPDGGFWMGTNNGVFQLFRDFAQLKASGQFEENGLILTEPIFALGFVGPSGDGSAAQVPTDFTLASSSNAKDQGKMFTGINSSFKGTAPDLGALELGCPSPTYGPRPAGREHLTPAIDCEASPPPANERRS